MNAVDEFEIKNPSKYLGNELAYLARVLESKSWSNTSGSWTQEGSPFQVYNGPITLNGVTAIPVYRLYDVTNQQHLLIQPAQRRGRDRHQPRSSSK